MQYLRTAKPRVISLLLFTTAGAFILADGIGRWTLLLVTLAGAALTMGGAAALNSYLERDRDRLLERTRDRPLPAGRVDPKGVLLFGLALCAAGTTVLAAGAGPLPAALAAMGAGYYVLLYTLVLKPRSTHGVVPGGMAGVFPALIGWSATGRPWSLLLLYLCVLVFCWSPPHYWALALARAEDYRRAGLTVLPLSRGADEARLQVALYLLALLALSVLPSLGGWMGASYLAAAALGGTAFALTVVRMLRRKTARSAWLVYRASGFYLALLLLGMVVDQIGRTSVGSVVAR